MNVLEWIAVAVVVVSIVGLIGWGTFDWISEQAGERREFPAIYDAADFSWTSVGSVHVTSRPRLYDWEAEGDL